MEEKYFYGNIKPEDIAQNLMSFFHQGNLRVQEFGDGSKINIQIATRNNPSSGGQTALNVVIQKIEDGISVRTSEQKWLGIAASLGFTALAAIRNPINLLTRLDDLAQDISYMTLQEDVWKVIEQTVRSRGASHSLSVRFKRITCSYCSTANPLGQPRCIACGAPLGENQPLTCIKCGYLLQPGEKKCPNCGTLI